MIKKVHIIILLFGWLFSPTNASATVAAGSPISATDIQDMRDDIDNKRVTICGGTPYFWATGPITAGTVISRAHFTEIATAANIAPLTTSGTLPTFPTSGLISASSVSLLRTWVDNSGCSGTPFYFCTDSSNCASNSYADLATCNAANNPNPCYATAPLCLAGAPTNCAATYYWCTDSATCTSGGYPDAATCQAANSKPCYPDPGGSAACTASAPIDCPVTCGNGSATDPGEECDDGGVAPGDGCDDLCQCEYGAWVDDACGAWTCLAGQMHQTRAIDPLAASQCTDVDQCVGSALCGCGNGSLDAGEECDDGGTFSADGCDSNCACEYTGWADDACDAGGCVKEMHQIQTSSWPSQCAAMGQCVPNATCNPPCGNLSCDAGENPCNSCGDPCPNICGDGCVSGPEQCDPPDGGATCTAGCLTPTCSDGIQNQGEVDTDCGGPCGCCGDGDSCGGNGDCCSGNCSTGTCQAVPPPCPDGFCDRGAGETNAGCPQDCCFNCTADVCLEGDEYYDFSASIDFSGGSEWIDVPSLPAVGFGFYNTTFQDSAGTILLSSPFECEGSGDGDCSGSGGRGKQCGWSCSNNDADPGSGNLNFRLFADNNAVRSQQAYPFAARTNPTDITDGCIGTACARVHPDGANPWNTAYFTAQIHCYDPDVSGPLGYCGDGTCDQDGYCDSPTGSRQNCTSTPEDFGNCPGDCPCDYNGSCDIPREDDTNCSDCGCGDGSCNFGEDASSCQVDCCSFGCGSDSDCFPTSQECPGGGGGDSLGPGDTYQSCGQDGDGCPACVSAGTC